MLHVARRLCRQPASASALPIDANREFDKMPKSPNVADTLVCPAIPAVSHIRVDGLPGAFAPWVMPRRSRRCLWPPKRVRTWSPTRSSNLICARMRSEFNAPYRLELLSKGSLLGTVSRRISRQLRQKYTSFLLGSCVEMALSVLVSTEVFPPRR